MQKSEDKIMDLAKLKEPFPVNLVSWRVGATNKNKNGGKATSGIALAYIDARDVMERLDEVVGIGNYQVIHPHANGKTSCRIGIKIGDEWVWKENGAGDSAMDAEKGAFSDSFKRAAVLWGIGRYLYDVPNIWVDLDDWGKIKNTRDQKLIKALEQAAKGIRSEPEPEPEIKEENPTKKWLSDAGEKLKTLKNPEEIQNFVRDNPRTDLSPEQVNWFNNQVKKANERTHQAP
jgi:hypothetical protein